MEQEFILDNIDLAVILPIRLIPVLIGAIVMRQQIIGYISIVQMMVSMYMHMALICTYTIQSIPVLIGRKVIVIFNMPTIYHVQMPEI